MGGVLVGIFPKPKEDTRVSVKRMASEDFAMCETWTQVGRGQVSADSCVERGRHRV